MEPTNDAQLFDMLHALFGIGDYDDSVHWYRFRMLEITKLKAIRKRRQIPLRDMACAARYCYVHHVQIHQSYELCVHIVVAKRDARRRAVPDLDRDIELAVTVARDRGEGEWASRLLRARGALRQEVLDEWRQQRPLTEK